MEQNRRTLKPLKDLNLLDRFYCIGNGAPYTIKPSEGCAPLPSTTSPNCSQCKSKKIHEMQKRIQQIKSSEESGAKYMQAWEQKIIDKRKAKEEGLVEGQKAGETRIKAFLSKLVEQNRMEDVKKAAADSDYLEELCREFKL